jgi:hypothetical protein
MDLSGQQIEVKVPKEKKPRSAAQQAATVKALAILKARREEKEKKEIEVKDAKVLANKKVREHKKKDLDNPVVTKKMMDEALKAHAEEIKKATQAQVAPLPPAPKPIAAAPPKAPSAKPSPAPAPAAAPAPAPAPPRPSTAEKQKLVGRELLDALFFK